MTRLEALKQTAAEGMYVTTIATEDFRVLLEIAERALGFATAYGTKDETAAGLKLSFALNHLETTATCQTKAQRSASSPRRSSTAPKAGSGG